MHNKVWLYGCVFIWSCITLLLWQNWYLGTDQTFRKKKKKSDLLQWSNIYRLLIYMQTTHVWQLWDGTVHNRILLHPLPLLDRPACIFCDRSWVPPWTSALLDATSFSPHLHLMELQGIFNRAYYLFPLSYAVFTNNAGLLMWHVSVNTKHTYTVVRLEAPRHTSQIPIRQTQHC